jgi:2-aminophenol/2-amino-5-chlorophenol 1,6-dioxygenase alpha subunit
MAVAEPAADVRAAFRGAALVPGMPQLHARRPAESWRRLADAVRATGEDLRAARPDVLVMLSTQWFTVLGHQLQMDPNPTGTRVDENWYAYDYGTLSYDLTVDTEFTERWAQEMEAEDFEARRTHYEHFPIDTGVVVAQPLLDPGGTLPVALVSTNLYATAEDIGSSRSPRCAPASATGRSLAFVAISALSSALTQRWIEPAEDRIESPEHERWNRRMLDLMAAGRSTRRSPRATTTPWPPRPTASSAGWPSWPARAA